MIPAAKWLLSLDLGDHEFAKLITTFSEVLARLSADDRAFDLGLDRFGLGDVIEAMDKALETPEYGNVISAIDKLIARCAEAGVSCEALVSCLRRYLAKTIQLPKGFPVRHSHATKAARGVRELTSPKRVPPEAVKRVVPLRR